MLSREKKDLPAAFPLWYNGNRKDVLNMGTEKERKDTQKALLYDLRLIFSAGEKENYSRTEIVELLDKIALAKDQE